MKNTLRITAVIMAAALIVCAFAGCGAKLDKTIIGKWEDVDNRAAFEFKDDGTFSYNSDNLTVLGISLGASVTGKYTVNTETEPATVTVTPEIAIAGFKAGTDIVFTASYDSKEKVLTLSNSDWGTLKLSPVE